MILLFPSLSTPCLSENKVLQGTLDFRACLPLSIVVS